MSELNKQQSNSEISEDDLREQRKRLYDLIDGLARLKNFDNIFPSETSKEEIRESSREFEGYLEQYFHDHITFDNEINNKNDPEHFPLVSEESKKKISSILARSLISDNWALEGEDPKKIDDPLSSTIRASKLVNELIAAGVTDEQELIYALYAVDSIHKDDYLISHVLEADRIALQYMILSPDEALTPTDTQCSTRQDKRELDKKGGPAK